MNNIFENAKFGDIFIAKNGLEFIFVVKNNHDVTMLRILKENSQLWDYNFDGTVSEYDDFFTFTTNEDTIVKKKETVPDDKEKQSDGLLRDKILDFTMSEISRLEHKQEFHTENNAITDAEINGSIDALRAVQKLVTKK